MNPIFNDFLALIVISVTGPAGQIKKFSRSHMVPGTCVAPAEQSFFHPVHKLVAQCLKKSEKCLPQLDPSPLQDLLISEASVAMLTAFISQNKETETSTKTTL